MSGTNLKPGDGNSFTDNSGNVYTLAGNETAVENGSIIPGGYGTSQMEFINGTVYGQDASSGSWSTWNQQNWSSSSPPSEGSNPPTIPPASSPSASDYIPVATPGSGSFTDSSGNLFDINPVNDTAQINGQPITPNGGSDNTVVLAYDQGNVYAQEAGDGTWFEMESKGSPGLYEWQPVTPPDLTIIQHELG